jgi:predicted nuclease of predicted toxin-antitoxin system
LASLSSLYPLKSEKNLNQLPATLVRWLQNRDCAAVHVLDLGLSQTTDANLWLHAARTGAVLITKDEDFSPMTLLRPEPVSVVWLRIGNCRTPVLLAKLERAWPDISAQLDAGARLVEVF